MVSKASTIWRDYNTANVPSTGVYEPEKPEIRKWGNWIETMINASITAGWKVFTSLADLQNSLDEEENTAAIVVGDPDPANNGMYMKVDGPGEGYWERVGDVPGTQFVQATNTGLGSPNSIIATSTSPISEDTLVLLPIVADNTASPVTVSFNDETPLIIKTSTGNDIPPGSLIEGMVTLGVPIGGDFRLISDTSTSNLIPIMEALVEDANEAADRAEDAYEAVVGFLNPYLQVKLDTVADGVTDTYDLITGTPATDGHLYLSVWVGNSHQPKDGLSYTIIDGGTRIKFSEIPAAGNRLYAESSPGLGSGESGPGPGPSPDIPPASGIVNDSSVSGATVAAALNTLNGLSGPSAVWTSARSLTMQQRSKFQCHIADFCAPSTTVDRTSEIMNWLTQGQNGGVKLVIGGDGNNAIADFITLQELEITRAGQVLEFEQSGGYGYGESIGPGWEARTRLRVAGGASGWFNTTGKRIRTRRLFRANTGAPQDTPLSCAINIQAEGVKLYRPCVWLDCDYGNTSSSNLGDYCDVGIFIGTRVGVQIHDPQVIGYFRRAGIYLDVTNGSGYPRWFSKAGTQYPAGTVTNGADGFHMWNPFIKGGRVGFAVLGARPKAGATGYGDQYFDANGNTLRTDNRGSFGCSDMNVFGGKIYGPDHHSNRRRQDPVSSPLNSTSLNNEPDDAPAAVYIDGLAGNSSSTLWNMIFHGTRISTFEKFRVRIGGGSRIRFIGCHIEGRDSSLRRTASGGTLTGGTNNYTNNTYACIAGNGQGRRVSWLFASVQTLQEGFGHYYGVENPFMLTDSGRIWDYNGIWRNGTSVGTSVVINTEGQLRRDTSALKYKKNLRRIPKERLLVFSELVGQLYNSKIKGEDDKIDHAGFVADYADSLGLKELVIYGPDGSPESFRYDRVTAFIYELMKLHNQEINERIDGLETRVTDLETSIRDFAN